MQDAPLFILVMVLAVLMGLAIALTVHSAIERTEAEVRASL